MKKSEIFTNGLIKNNPTFRLVLGTCPTLAVTTTALNSLGMGAAVTFVLTCSNMMISALRKVIPDKVRIPAFVLIIATFVTVIEMVMRKFIPSLYESLGLFLPLIVVNCIILARAEAFASTNTVLDSAVDGLGMGLGFTCSLTLIGIIRELLGAGSFFGLTIPGISDISMVVFILPAGGFLVFGFMMALFNHIFAKVDERKAKKLEEAKKQQLIDAVVTIQEAVEEKKAKQVDKVEVKDKQAVKTEKPTKVETKVEKKVEDKPKIETEVKTETKAEVKAEVEVDAKVETNNETKQEQTTVEANIVKGNPLPKISEQTEVTNQAEVADNVKEG